jgi:hypothetical protein
MNIQDAFLFFRPGEDTLATGVNVDVREAGLRLGERSHLVAWLPHVRRLQLEQIAVDEMCLVRAAATLEALQDYANAIADNAPKNSVD